MATKTDRLSLGDEGLEIQPIRIPLTMTIAEATALLSKLQGESNAIEESRADAVTQRLRATLGLPLKAGAK